MTLTDLPKIETANIKKILLLRPRRMGDIILTTPALKALRSLLPLAHISYLVETPYARLIEGNNLVDEVIAIQPRPSFAAFLAIIKKIRKKKFDAVIDFHGGPRCALFVLTSGSPLKIGYETKYKAWVYDYRVPRSYVSGPVHSVVNHLNLVRILNPKISEDYSLQVPPPQLEEKRKIEIFWKQLDLSSRRVAAVHISAGNQFRDWGTNNLVSFLKHLVSLSVTPLLIGSREDKLREKEILKNFKGEVISLVGETSLGELMAVLERVDLFVGPDSGPMHLAAALNKPIVALFGPTIPAHFAPWKARAIIIEKPLSCRPCRQRSCPEKNYSCIREIRPDEVIKACLILLGLEAREEKPLAQS